MTHWCGIRQSRALFWPIIIEYLLLSPTLSRCEADCFPRKFTTSKNTIRSSSFIALGATNWRKEFYPSRTVLHIVHWWKGLDRACVLFRSPWQVAVSLHFVMCVVCIIQQSIQKSKIDIQIGRFDYFYSKDIPDLSTGEERYLI